MWRHTRRNQFSSFGETDESILIGGGEGGGVSSVDYWQSRLRISGSNAGYTRIRMELQFWSCSQAVSKPVWHIPLLCVQWKTPDDGQRNCPKHVEFHSKNKFEKSVHLVGFIIRNLTRCTVTWTSNSFVSSWYPYQCLDPTWCQMQYNTTQQYMHSWKSVSL